VGGCPVQPRRLRAATYDNVPEGSFFRGSALRFCAPSLGLWPGAVALPRWTVLPAAIGRMKKPPAALGGSEAGGLLGRQPLGEARGASCGCLFALPQRGRSHLQTRPSRAWFPIGHALGQLPVRQKKAPRAEHRGQRRGGNHRRRMVALSFAKETTITAARQTQRRSCGSALSPFRSIARQVPARSALLRLQANYLPRIYKRRSAADQVCAIKAAANRP
jgi:hypothetical protein